VKKKEEEKWLLMQAAREVKGGRRMVADAGSTWKKHKLCLLSGIRLSRLFQIACGNAR
jgi:hypothetical protein